MEANVKFCCVFFIAVVLVGVAHGEHMCSPYIVSGDLLNRQCPPQLERERAKQNINNCIRNILPPLHVRVPNCGPGLWYRVAHLDLTVRSQQCPSTWMEYNSTSGLRACGRQFGVDCSSVNYTSNGLRYRKVCGQAIGYQLKSTDVFDNLNRSIDSAYVDGVSITHGMPRRHIWTYAAGSREYPTSRYDCPCLVDGNGYTPQIPPSFVGDNYYCESGNHLRSGYPQSITDTSDLLWDGKQCEGQCCSNGKSPPWFSVDLPNPTTDDIEVRLCDTDNLDGEDTPIKLLELYIQV